jgi:hypothetical protein
MIKPVYSILSHARGEKQKTLEYLHSLGIQKDRIYLCVWDSEADEYRNWSAYAQILPSPMHSIGGDRNYILDTIKETQYFIQLDDDISKISYLNHGKLEPINDGKQFENLISYGFSTCIRHGAKLWGIYPVYNAFFMKDKISTKGLLNSFFGIINDGMRFIPDFKVKEDYEFCCRSLKKYGVVVRLDNVACNAVHYSKGGCENVWNTNNKMCNVLMKLHGDILKLNPRRKGEVLLK